MGTGNNFGRGVCGAAWGRAGQGQCLGPLPCPLPCPLPRPSIPHRAPINAAVTFSSAAPVVITRACAIPFAFIPAACLRLHPQIGFLSAPFQGWYQGCTRQLCGCCLPTVLSGRYGGVPPSNRPCPFPLSGSFSVGAGLLFCTETEQATLAAPRRAHAHHTPTGRENDQAPPLSGATLPTKLFCRFPESLNLKAS